MYKHPTHFVSVLNKKLSYRMSLKSHWSLSMLAVWLSGNALVTINVVALRQTWLVPKWVTVCNQPTRSTQPSTLCGTVK